MGFGGTDLSSIFGGSGLGSLASAFMQPNQAVPQLLPGDPSAWGGPQYAGVDPTGSLQATTDITGNTASIGPAGPPDIGGQQSDTQAGAAPQGAPQAPQPPPQPPPQPQTTQMGPEGPAQVAQGPFSPAQQPTVPGPTGWTTGAGPPSPAPFYGQPPGFHLPGGFADTRGTYGLPGSDTPPVTDPLTQRAAASTDYGPGAHGGAPPSWLDGAQATVTPSGGFPQPTAPDTPPTEVSAKPDETSQDAAPSPASAQPKPPTQGDGAATQPPRAGAAGQGGFPGAGGIGNFIRDIMGIMSGNPMALGALVQDLARLGGQQGVGGFPGQPGMQPWMQPNQAVPQTMRGDPSTFGGPQYAGATPGDQLPAQVGPGRVSPHGRIGPPTPEERAEADRQWGRAPQQPGQRPPQGPTAARGAPGAQPGTGQLTAAVSAPAAAGPAASTPLTANEVRVPQTVGGRTPPMRPMQPNVDRSSFQNENNDDTAYRAAWMVNGEVGSKASTRQKIVQLETAFNRAQYRHHSLAHALLASRQRDDGGYYQGRPGQTPTYRESARPTPEQFAAFKRDVWDPVMKGSNLSDIGYGPMTGNASAGTAANQFRSGTPGYTFGQESYFREGTGSRPLTDPLPQIRQQPAPLPQRQIAPGAQAALRARTSLQEMGLV